MTHERYSPPNILYIKEYITQTEKLNYKKSSQKLTYIIAKIKTFLEFLENKVLLKQNSGGKYSLRKKNKR